MNGGKVLQRNRIGFYQIGFYTILDGVDYIIVIVGLFQFNLIWLRFNQLFANLLLYCCIIVIHESTDMAQIGICFYAEQQISDAINVTLQN